MNRINKIKGKVSMNIYVASSWKNKSYQSVLNLLVNEGHHVYDFRNPDTSFAWVDCMPDRMPNGVDHEVYGKMLQHPKAEVGFASDFEAMKTADMCVLLLPCGKSAHLEAGRFVGHGKPVVVLMEEVDQLELMYKLCDKIVGSYQELLEAVGKIDVKLKSAKRHHEIVKRMPQF